MNETKNRGVYRDESTNQLHCEHQIPLYEDCPFCHTINGDLAEETHFLTWANLIVLVAVLGLMLGAGLWLWAGAPT